jgi:predicted ester cyclase
MIEAEIILPLQRFYDDLINKGDLSVIDEIIGPNYYNHAAPFGLSTGVDGLKKLLEEFIIAFPDQHIVAKKIFAKDNMAIAIWEITGTHLGEFFGKPATGKKICMTGIDIEIVENGKIVEHFGGEDMMLLLSQIEAITLPQA